MSHPTSLLVKNSPREDSRKTISRLIEKFNTGGIEALRRKTRTDKGQQRVSENTFKFIKGKLLSHPKLSFATIQRQLNRLNAHAAEFTASYQQIRRIRQSLSEDLLVLAQSETEFEETRELLIRHVVESLKVAARSSDSSER